MSFETQEESRAHGQPVLIALIRYGANPGAVFAYTTAERPITVDGITYNPETMDFAEITSSGTLDKVTLEVTVKLANSVSQLFRVAPPTYPITLTLRQGQIGQPDFPVAWMGRIVGRTCNAGAATLQCEPASTSLRMAGLRRNYSYGCPYALYGPLCKASLAAASITLVPVGIGPDYIDLSPGWAPEDLVPKYRGGLVIWQDGSGSVYRSIIRIDSMTRLRLNGPTTTLAGSVPVQVAFGCGRTVRVPAPGVLVSDCQSLHNNIKNFGGQFAIPTENPLGVGNNLFY